MDAEFEFFATPDQNACWTQFDGDSPSINSNDLIDIEAKKRELGLAK